MEREKEKKAERVMIKERKAEIVSEQESFIWLAMKEEERKRGKRKRKGFFWAVIYIHIQAP